MRSSRRGPLEHHTDSWASSTLFGNVRYGCEVLSFPSESIMVSSDCDLAKIIAWVQRPISSCYFGLCKLPALSSSCSSFFWVSVPFSCSGRWAVMTKGDWKTGNRRQKSRNFVGLFPSWLVPGYGQTRSPSLKPLRPRTLERGQNLDSCMEQTWGGGISWEKSAANNRGSLMKNICLWSTHLESAAHG